MKWVLYLVVLIGATFLAGYALLATTTVSRSITLQQPPEAVFAVLADVQKIADWNRTTEKVEMLPPRKGLETTRQIFKGGVTMTVVTTESTPPGRLVRAMGDDDDGPFVGSWSYEISPAEGGSRVVLTEVATFKNPIFRVLTRVFGQTKYLDEHLEDLAKKFGETAKAS